MYRGGGGGEGGMGMWESRRFIASASFFYFFFQKGSRERSTVQCTILRNSRLVSRHSMTYLYINENFKCFVCVWFKRLEWCDNKNANHIYYYCYRCLWRCWTRTTTRHWRANRSTGWAWRRIHRHEQPSHASRHSTATSSVVAAARWSTIWKPAILSRCLTLTPTLVRTVQKGPLFFLLSGYLLT